MIIANLNHLSHHNKINMSLRFKNKSNNNIWSSLQMITRLNNSNYFINHQLLLANHPKLFPSNSTQNLTVKSTCKKLLMRSLLCKINNLLKKRKIKIRLTEPLSNKSSMTEPEKSYWNSLTIKQYMKSMVAFPLVNKPTYITR